MAKLTIQERIKQTIEMEHDLGCIDYTGEIIKERLNLEDYYFDSIPQEIGWDELKELNEELYNDLVAIEKYCGIKRQ